MTTIINQPGAKSSHCSGVGEAASSAWGAPVRCVLEISMALHFSVGNGMVSMFLFVGKLCVSCFFFIPRSLFRAYFGWKKICFKILFCWENTWNLQAISYSSCICCWKNTWDTFMTLLICSLKSGTWRWFWTWSTAMVMVRIGPPTRWIRMCHHRWTLGIAAPDFRGFFHLSDDSIWLLFPFETMWG